MNFPLAPHLKFSLT